MSALGRHILAEFYGCPSEILSDLEQIKQQMLSAALEAGAEVRETVFHQFSP
ncbi:MAG TPA: S-adenosylmethionine decarboxylase proenzyme, partial [Firmicutes bacterium]|nr:S-adenosylmethionine decarboxylase proenzyme [Bacillota bacterium]